MGTETEIPRLLRMLLCLRIRTSRTMPSMRVSDPQKVMVRTWLFGWPKRSTRPSRCSSRVGFQGRS